MRRLQHIAALARSVTGDAAFDEVHLLLPDPANPEPAFIRAVSWLYCLYFEAGRVSLAFLRRLGEGYSVVDRRTADRHVEDVRCLRTELHHNLGVENSEKITRSAAEHWRRKACGTALPRAADEWQDCYNHLVDDAAAFLQVVEAVVRRIEAGGHEAEAHVEEWRLRLRRSWPAVRFDPLIEDVKYRLGREALNVVAFRNRYIDKWRKHLDLLDDEFNFEFEATRLIEKALLDEGASVLPITGVDVIQNLEIEPGPQVGLLLEEARRHFQESQCCRAKLLAHLRDYMVRGV